MRSVYLFCLVIWAFCAAEGSAQNKDSLVFNTEIGLYNRYIWRGINFGDAPSLQGTCSLAYRGFEAGFSGANSLSGTALGYANTLEVFANYTYRGFMVGVSDNFFYEAFDSLNRYFDYGADTPHYLEGKLKYTQTHFYVQASYNFYSRASNKTTGIYLEGGCNLTKQVRFVIGGITAESFLNFHSQAGITNIGIYYKKPIKISTDFSLNAQFGLIANPNYRYIAQVAGVIRNPIYFLMSITF